MFKKKESEKELAEPKAKPAAAAAAADVIEAMGDGLIVADLDGNIISINRAMEEYLAEGGIDAKKFIGRSALDLPTIRPEDIEKYAELIKEVIEKGRAGPFEAPDLAGNWSSFTGSLLKDADGNPTVLFAVVRDITELKRAEEERVAAMQERAAIVDGMPDALNVLDLDGRIVAVNPAYVKMFGWKPEEVIGKSVEDMSETFAKPEDLEYILKTMGEVIETGTAVKPVETLVLTKDGREVPISVTYSLIKDAEGNLKNLVTSIRDITELKRLQEKEKAAAAENARAEEAEKYSKELEKKIRDLETFQKVTMGREKRVIELKDKIWELEKRLKEKG